MNEAEAVAAMKGGQGAATESHRHLRDLSMAKMLRCRVRYFTDGAVIGSKDFVTRRLQAHGKGFPRGGRTERGGCGGRRRRLRGRFGVSGTCGRGVSGLLRIGPHTCGFFAPRNRVISALETGEEKRYQWIE